MSDQVPFGLGILNEGELIDSPEKHRLLAKRAWMQLHKFLSMNDEPFKALRIPVPHCLDMDEEIIDKLKWTQHKLSRFASEEHLRHYITSDEDQYDMELLEGILADAAMDKNPRRRWMFDVIMARNPRTVLDIGTGYGELAVMLGREGVTVTGINANRIGRDALNNYAQENSLPIEVVDGVFEYTEFGDRKFDVVVVGEVIEHVRDDFQFLQECCDLASDIVVLTTPVGSCEEGFIPNAAWASQDAHVRAYSDESFRRLVNNIPGFKPITQSEISSVKGHRGQEIKCYCAVLKRRNANDYQGITAEPVAQHEGH